MVKNDYIESAPKCVCIGKQCCRFSLETVCYGSNTGDAYGYKNICTAKQFRMRHIVRNLLLYRSNEKIMSAKL